MIIKHALNWTGEWTEEHWKKLEQDLDRAYAIYGEELARTDPEIMTASHEDWFSCLDSIENSGQEGATDSIRLDTDSIIPTDLRRFTDTIAALIAPPFNWQQSPVYDNEQHRKIEELVDVKFSRRKNGNIAARMSVPKSLHILCVVLTEDGEIYVPTPFIEKKSENFIMRYWGAGVLRKKLDIETKKYGALWTIFSEKNILAKSSPVDSIEGILDVLDNFTNEICLVEWIFGSE